MDLLLGVFNKADRKWYHIIGWWEIRRLPYNVIMVLTGYVSFYIAYITIPLIYIFIGLALNILYCLAWITDISITRRNNITGIHKNNSKKVFLTYLVLSMLVVFGVAIAIK